MKSHDVIVLCKLLIWQSENKEWTYSSLSKDVCLSVGETHNCVRRLKQSKFYDEFTMSVVPEAATEFFVHGIKYVFPAEIGPIEIGIPTSHSAPIFSDDFFQSEEDIYVWPYYKGSKRGRSIIPLSKRTPEAALKDEKLYAMLSLIDAVRVGKARERNLAVEKLKGIIEDMG